MILGSIFIAVIKTGFHRKCRVSNFGPILFPFITKVNVQPPRVGSGVSFALKMSAIGGLGLEI